VIGSRILPGHHFIMSRKTSPAKPKYNKILKEFCDNTSIHGLKYLFEEGSLLIERYSIA
jgi:hypothetical protein